MEKFFKQTLSMGYLAVVESKAWACASLTGGDMGTFLTKRDADTIFNL